MSSPYFTLVVEDRAHDLFVYRLLLHWGLHRQRIRVVPYPDGQGCGEQHSDCSSRITSRRSAPLTIAGSSWP